MCATHAEETSGSKPSTFVRAKFLNARRRRTSCLENVYRVCFEKKKSSRTLSIDGKHVIKRDMCVIHAHAQFLEIYAETNRSKNGSK